MGGKQRFSVISIAILISLCLATQAQATEQHTECSEIAANVSDLLKVPYPIPESYTSKTYSDNAKKARDLIDQSPKSCENTREWLLSAADIYLRTDKTSELETALKYGIAALDMKPEDAVSNHLVGVIYMQMQNYSNGLKYIKKCVELDTNTWGLWLNYCSFLVEAEEFETAVDVCQKTSGFLDLEDKIKGQAFYMKSYSHLKLGEVDQAKTDYKTAQSLGYDFPPIDFKDK